jgi:hypothetical protein
VPKSDFGGLPSSRFLATLSVKGLNNSDIKISATMTANLSLVAVHLFLSQRLQHDAVSTVDFLGDYLYLLFNAQLKTIVQK